MPGLRARRQGNLPQTEVDLAGAAGPLPLFPRDLQPSSRTCRFAKAFAEDRLRVDENTKEELLDLVIEMFERFDKIHVETHDDLARQKRFFNLIGPEHFCNMAASRVCSRFLVRHEDLFGP